MAATAGLRRTSPRFHLSARLRALPPEREWSAKRYPADALPFGMQYCLRKLGNLALIKILVVDDHALIREALHGVLRKLTRDAVILEASNCAQTMETVASHPDISLILLDLNLPDRDGFSLLAELRERNPAVSLVVLSAVQDRATVMKALDLGAMGYIPKSARNEVMLSALQLVFAGGIYIPPEILAREHYLIPRRFREDRKSTRLNSSHANISYAVFCLKKKKKTKK